MSLQFTTGVPDASRSDDTTVAHGSDAPVVLHAADVDTVVVPFGAFVLEADYARQGSDLVLSDDAGHEVIVRDYFASDDAPALSTEGGAVVAADLVARLAGSRAPGQYAAEGDTFDSQPIGKVSEIDGDCTATRVDGSKVTLAKDMPIFQGDVIETGDGAALAVTFVDQSTFSVGGDARMVVDELVFDASSLNGSSSVSLLQGVFVFVSGEIAANNPEQMLVRTPVATIGIRGTATAVEAHQEGQINRVVLLPEKAAECVAAGGNLEHCGETVGAVRVFNEGGSVVLDEKFETTAIDSVFSIPLDPTVSTPEQVASMLRQLSAVVPDSVGAVTELRHGAGGTPGVGETFQEQDGPGAPNTDVTESFSSSEEGEASTSDTGEGETGESGTEGEDEGASIADELSEIAPAAGGPAAGPFNNDFTQVTDGSSFALDPVDSIVPDPIASLIGQPTTPTPSSSFFNQGPPPPPPPPAPPPGSAGGPVVSDGTEGSDDEEVIAGGGGEVVTPPGGGGGGGTPVIIPEGLVKLADSFTTNDNPVTTAFGTAPSTGTQTATVTFTTTGQHIIAFGNFDEGDFVVESPLFLDNVRLNGNLIAGFNGSLGSFTAQFGAVQFNGGPGILPTEGAQQLVMFAGGGTAAQVEAFLNLPAGSLSALADDGNSGNGAEVATDGTLIFALINAQAGDVLTFDYNYLDIENDLPGQTFNDFAFFFSGLFTGNAGSLPTNGDDALVGTIAGETINALGGNDTVTGLGGDDTLIGGQGDDTLLGGDGDDRLLGDSGEDLLQGGNNDDQLIGGADGDTLQGGDGDDFYLIQQGDGSDRINDASGDDTVEFAPEIAIADMVRIGTNLLIDLRGSITQIDLHYGGQQVEFLTYDFGFGDNTYNLLTGLTGGAGDDAIAGTSGNLNSINGGAGDDVLFGQNLFDTLIGGTGRDYLVLGGSVDDLIGGTAGGGGDGETDFFVFRSPTDGTQSLDNQLFAGAVSAIADFESGIDAFVCLLDQFGYPAGFEGTLADLEFVTGVPIFSVVAGYDGTNFDPLGQPNQFIFDSNSRILFFDDNTATPGYFALAQIQPGGTITADDIILSDFIAATVPNFAPVITELSGASAGTPIFVAENTAGTFITITATDVENQAFTFSIGANPDASFDNTFFTIDSSTGALRFTSPPDFEFTDPGNDDLYKVRVTVTDALNASSFRDYFVQVTDINEVAGATPFDDTLVLSAGDDFIDALAGNDTVFGAGGNDTLIGNQGNDRLFGEAGNDTLTGGSGEDLLVGGFDDDTYVFSAADANVLNEDDLQDSGGNDTLTFESGPAFDFTASNVGDLSVHYGSLELFIDNHYTGSPVENVVADFGFGLQSYLLSTSTTTGGAGNDIIAGVSAGQNFMNGGGGNDALFGHLNDDELAGEAGDDFLQGGAGNDGLSGDAGNDILIGGAGNDNMLGGDDNDHLFGGAGNDGMAGGAGVDTLFGDAGNDVLIGGAGDDVLQGGADDDSYVFFSEDPAEDGTGQDDVVLDTGGTIDTFDFEPGTIIFDMFKAGITLNIGHGADATNRVQIINYNVAGSEIEHLIYDAGNGETNYLIALGSQGTNGDDIIASEFAAVNTINGNGGNDIIFAGAQFGDTLSGGQGNDIIYVLRQDTVFGNEDADSFVFRSSGESQFENDGVLFSGPVLIIGDFAGAGLDSDTLVFNNSIIGFNIPIEGTLADIFASTGQQFFSEVSNYDGTNAGAGETKRFIFDPISRNLYFDVDVTSNGYLALAHFDGTNPVTAADIVISDLRATTGGGLNLITGTDNGEPLNGTNGADLIDALGGNDTLNGLTGADTLQGGFGDDTYKFLFADIDGQPSIIIEPGGGSLVGGSDTIEFELGYPPLNFTSDGTDLNIFVGGDLDVIKILGQYTGQGLEFIVADLNLNGFADDLYKISASNDTGSNGVDDLIVAREFPLNVMSGGSGDDVMFGSSFADVISGGADNDVLHGANGDDRLFGGLGADILFGGFGADTLQGNGGNDVLQGDSDSDIYEFDGDEALLGDIDVIFDTDGALDILRISDSAPILSADGIGSVLFHYGTAGGFIVVEAQTADPNFSIERIEYNFFAGPGVYNFSNNPTDGTAGDDVIVGSFNIANTITAGNGSDVLFGQDSGGEVLLGGAGSDILFAGGVDGIVTLGPDTLTGGADADFFAFVNPDEGVTVFSNTPFTGAITQVTDFTSADDQFVFFGEAFGILGDALLSDIDAATTDTLFMAVAGYDGSNASLGDPNDAIRFIFDPDTDTLYFDSNTEIGGYTVIAQVQSGANITAADIRISDFTNGA